MKLIIGLGNPGKEYARTRHNAGYLAVDAFAKVHQAQWSTNDKRKATISKFQLDEQSILLAKPLTFMNLSGEAVQSLLSYYKADLKDVLVIQDELDLPVGQLAFIEEGGDAGHNGIASIQEMLGTKKITRLRIGVGRPTNAEPIEKWVLGPMDRQTVDTIDRTPEAVEDWLVMEMGQVMNRWNRK